MLGRTDIIKKLLEEVKSSLPKNPGETKLQLVDPYVSVFLVCDYISVIFFLFSLNGNY